MVVEPAELLEHLCVLWVLHEYALVRLAGHAEFLLLLVHVTDLEPDVDLGEGLWGAMEDVPEALQAGGELVLLLVDDAEAEVDFVGLVEVGSDLDDAGESLLGVLEAAVSVVEDTDAVPELRIL